MSLSFIALHYGCDSNQERHKEKTLLNKNLRDKLVYDSLINVPLDNGFKPKHSISFSHSIHSGKLELGCNHCHSTGKTTFQPVGFAVCSNCHNVANQYVDLIIRDKKSYLENMNELNNKIKRE